MIEAELVVLNGPASGKATPIRPGQDISVGRKIDANSMPISDGYMSRQHFIVGVTDDEVWLQDCGSSHGTFWNDQKIDGRIALKNADRIRAGSTDFVVRIKEPVTEVPDSPARAPQRSPSETAGFDEPISPKAEDSWSGAVSSARQSAPPPPPPAPAVPPPVAAAKPPVSPPAPPSKIDADEAPSIFDRPEPAPASEVPSLFGEAPSAIPAEPMASEPAKPSPGGSTELPDAKSSVPASSSIPAKPASFDDAWDDSPAEEEKPAPAVSPSATAARSTAKPPMKAPMKEDSTSSAENTSAAKSAVPRAPAKPTPAASSIDWDDDPPAAEPPPSVVPPARPVEQPAKKPADDDDWWPD